MMHLELTVLSLRYSSWSMRPWLVLTHAGAEFVTKTVEVEVVRQTNDGDSADGSVSLAGISDRDVRERRTLGSVTGLFPVLDIDGSRVHESLAICEWAADAYPNAGLWPTDRTLRAQARAISTEMAAGFSNLRSHLSCQPFARVPDFRPNEATQSEIRRVFEIWSECLDRSGGPFLFGSFGIPDAMYFPVLTRFHTYGVDLPKALRPYADALWASPPVTKWRLVARNAPRLPVYDAYIRELGGDPDAATV